MEQTKKINRADQGWHKRAAQEAEIQTWVQVQEVALKCSRCGGWVRKRARRDEEISIRHRRRTHTFMYVNRDVTFLLKSNLITTHCFWLFFFHIPDCFLISLPVNIGWRVPKWLCWFAAINGLWWSLLHTSFHSLLCFPNGAHQNSSLWNFLFFGYFFTFSSPQKCVRLLLCLYMWIKRVWLDLFSLSPALVKYFFSGKGKGEKRKTVLTDWSLLCCQK